MQNKGSAFFQILTLTAVVLAAGCHRGREPVSGTIEVDEVHVGSRYGGRVEKIHAQEGDTLKEGDLIVEMDAAELRAKRDMQAAQLDEMVNGPRKAEIEAAHKDWEALQAQLAFASSEAKRQEDLLAHKTVSPSDSQRATSTAQALEKSVEASAQRYRLLQEGTRPEQIAQSRAQLAETDAQLAEMRVTAPGPSVLESLSVKVGDVLSANQEVAALLLPQHLWVRVYVPETWLGFIKVGQQVRLRVDSFGGRDFSGEVEQVRRKAEFTPRNVQTVEDRVKQVFGVKIRIKNDGDQLRAGMSADVFFSDAKP
jgi:HlyD family secretion protein